MKAQHPREMRLAEEAADWFTRLAEDADDKVRTDFVAWLKRSPRHMEEFLLVSATHRLFRNVDPARELDLQALLKDAAREVLPFPRDSFVEADVPSQRPTGPFRRRLWTVGIAAAACLLVAVAGFLTFRFLGGQDYSTGIGEQRAFRLDDGSLVHLNTRSRAEVRFTSDKRDIRLLEGEALFTVQHDADRPFRVLTRNAVVQAIGTQFNVYERKDGTRVSVVEGRVQIIDQGSTPALLAAGEEASVRANGKITRQTAPDVTTAVAWRQRRLAFYGATLAEVVEEFNRYNKLELRFEGDGNFGRQITAVFNADEPEALLQFLGREPSVQLERHANVVIIRPSR